MNKNLHVSRYWDTKTGDEDSMERSVPTQEMAKKMDIPAVPPFFSKTTLVPESKWSA